MKNTNKRYPITANCKDGDIELQLFSSDRRDDMLSFAKKLPEHDLLFLKRNITQPKVVDAWINSIESGDTVSIIASRGTEILGCTALLCDKFSWSPHVGEVRVLIAPQMKEQGLGRLLIQECFIVGLQLGLAKLTAQMTADQEAAIAIFEDMGFKAEALLRDHVVDKEGQKHDIIALSQDVEQFHAQMDMYGLNQAF